MSDPLDILAQAMPDPQPTRRRVLAWLAGAVAVAPLVACRPDSPMVAAAPLVRRASANADPARLLARATTDGAGATLKRLFPGAELRHLDPFVLLDDFDVAAPAGFPMHPHRGFEAFTYMLDGRFHHRDTMGNDSEVATGGTQRFTSGRGARHSEMPGAGQSNRGLQLWVNLPRELKQMDPEYAAVHGADIPDVTRGRARIRTVVGPESPVVMRTDMRYLDIALPRGVAYEDEIAPAWKGVVYVIDGSVRVGDTRFRAGEAALVQPGEIGLRAEPDSRVAMIVGRPHDQPILQRGPFVD